MTTQPPSRTKKIALTRQPCANGERRYREFTYDAYGDTIETRNHGNLDATDDEVTTANEFYPDTSGYITNRTARTVSYFGIGTAGAKLTDALFFYDDALSYNAAPSQGLITNQSVWLDTEDRSLSIVNRRLILAGARGGPSRRRPRRHGPRAA